jgi:hypothetical protein
VFRTTDIVLIAITVSAAAFTYKTKHEAEKWLTETHKLSQQIQYEKDTMDILKADWSLLTQPSRLQQLAEIYDNQLELEPVGAHQIVELDELPARPLTIEDLSSQRLGGMADSGRDNIVTGGVVQ